ncbi:MAG: hypothetical protein Q9197_006024, partial [Variospora fuerteventurae]
MAMQIEAQPGTCLGLIKTDDPAVEVMDVHSTVYAWSEASVGHVEEKDGGISTATTSEDGHHVQDHGCCARDSGFDDTTSPPLLSRPAEQLHVSPEGELDMEMFLSQPDALGWRDFSIPRLLTEPEADADGLLEFSLGAESGAKGTTSCDQLPSDACWPCVTSLPSTQFDCNGCVLVKDEQDGWLKGTFLTTQRLRLRMRSRALVHRLEHWNSAVTIYSTTAYGSGRGMELRHSASLTIAPQEEIFAERVVFALLIRNGPRASRTYRLEPGQCWMQFSEDVYDGKPQDRGAVEIFIERDVRDMDKRLGLEFTCRYPSEKASVHLPTISPRVGKVLSERIWLLEPMAPLKLHAVCKRFLSTWQVSKRTLAKRKLLCFDRIEVSRFYPVGFVDDAVVQIRGALSLSRSCDGFDRVEHVDGDDGWVRGAAERGKKLAAKVENIRFVGGVPLQPRKVRFDDEGASTTTSSEDEDTQSAASSAGEDEGSGSSSSSGSESSGEQRPVHGDDHGSSASDGISTVGGNNTVIQPPHNENHDPQNGAENEEDRADYPRENESRSDSRSDTYSHSFGDSSSESRSGDENLSSDDSEDHALEEMVEDLARSILTL